jgi:hypothetical protein
MRQSYELQIHELNNQLKKDQISSIFKDKITTKKVTIPDNPTSPVFEESILDESECSNDPYEKAYLYEIIETKKFKTELRYRGSRDGWKREDFHRMSDGKGPTVTLFKIKENGQCVGGFTSA